jgi:hypothetical protein
MTTYSPIPVTINYPVKKQGPKKAQV